MSTRLRSFTRLQGQYLSFIAAYERVHGRPPAEADFQRHFRVTPPSVHQMILTLARKGLVSRVPGSARSIVLQVPVDELPLLARPQSASVETRPALPSRTVNSRATTPAAPKASRKSKTSTRQERSKPDPATEYIDGPLMTHRVRHPHHVSAQIEGRYGIYCTRAQLTRRSDGECTCPSDLWPCKHVRALRATWKENPNSFFDMPAFLRVLRSRQKEDLIDSIDRIVTAFPAALGVLGVDGFDSDDTDVDAWEG